MFTLNYALHALQVALHLISVGKLGDEGCRVVFKVAHCQVLRSNKVLTEGARKGKHLYYLQCDMPYFEHAATTHAIPNLETWHRHLGHVNYTSIMKMAKEGAAIGMPTDLSTLPPICQYCILGKQTKKAVPKQDKGQEPMNY